MKNNPYEHLLFALNKLHKQLCRVVFVKGRPGVGKSYQIKQFLENNEISYMRITGDVSEGYFYRFLFENNGQIIWVNDSVKLLKNQGTMNILKSLTELEGPTIITKHTYNQNEIELPQSFECNSSFIFDFNSEIPKNLLNDFDALKSRGECTDIILSNQDIIDIAKEIFKSEEFIQVIEFIQEQLNKSKLITIDLRTIVKGVNTKIYCNAYGGDWKKHILTDITISSAIKQQLYELIGTEPILKHDLKELLLRKGLVKTSRTANSRIREWIESGVLFECGTTNISKRYVSLYEQ